MVCEWNTPFQKRLSLNLRISCHWSDGTELSPLPSSSDSMRGSSICPSVRLFVVCWTCCTHTVLFKISPTLIQRPSACVRLPASLSHRRTKRCSPVKTMASSAPQPPRRLSQLCLRLLLCLPESRQYSICPRHFSFHVIPFQRIPLGNRIC